MPLILILEDDHDIREELVAVLATRGYDVLSTRDGTEAFELVRGDRRRPDAIVLDLMLPGMDGTEFLEQQHEEPLLDGVPVIVMTAWAGQLRFVTETVRAVLEKPFPLIKVLQLVREVMSPPA